MSRTMLATVYIDRSEGFGRRATTARTPVATLPVMLALRVARDIADRNPCYSTWALREYARPISTLVRLGPPTDEWRSPDDLLTFEAEIRYEPSVGDLIRDRGWAAV